MKKKIGKKEGWGKKKKRRKKDEERKKWEEEGEISTIEKIVKNQIKSKG